MREGHRPNDQVATTHAKAIRCSIVRGGTSRGVLVRTEELASDVVERKRQILRLFGAPHPYQLDGVGGGSVQTSKLAILGTPTHSKADLDYTFAQIGIADDTVDQSGTCGNLSAAAALWGVEERIVDVVAGEATAITLHNTNTGKLIVAVVDGPEGGLPIAGACSSVYLNYSHMASGGESSVFPTGKRRQTIQLSDGSSLEVTLCNVGNAMVYVRAQDLGLTGREAPAALDSDALLVERLGQLRAASAQLLREAGLAGLDKGPTRLPLVSILATPEDQDDIDGEDSDLLVRLYAVGRTHLTIAGSAAISAAAAASYDDNLASELSRRSLTSGTLRIRHPAGVMRVDVQRSRWTGFDRLAYERTARRIMDGIAYV